MTPDGHCETIGELMDYIEANAERIFVRAKNAEGRFDSIPLSQMRPTDVLTHAFRWLRAGQTPIVVLPEAEGAES